MINKKIGAFQESWHANSPNLSIFHEKSIYTIDKQINGVASESELRMTMLSHNVHSGNILRFP